MFCHVLKHPLTHFNKRKTFYRSRVVMAIINNLVTVKLVQLLAKMFSRPVQIFYDK